MLDTSTMSVLETALNYASVRQDALADNVANINTPAYQRKDASFAQVLAQANPSNDTGQLAGERDNAGQISFGTDTQTGNIEVTTPEDGAMRMDGNNVDVDVEMGRLAKNQIYFQGVAQLIGGQFSAMKYVIGGGNGG